MTKLTAFGTAGEIAKGSVLSSDALIASYYRQSSNDATGEETPLTDAQILKIVAAVDGDNEDAEVERCEMIEKGIVPTDQIASASDIAAAGKRATEATNLADIAAKSNSFTTVVGELVAVFEKVKTAGRDFYLALKGAIGDSGMAQMPARGTTIDGRDQTVKALNYDVYWLQGKTSTGKLTDVRHSYLEEFALGLPFAKALQKEIDDAGTKYGTGKDCKDPLALEAIVKRNTPRLGTIVKMVKVASDIHHIVNAIAAYPGARMNWVPGSEPGSFAPTSSPVYIEDTSPGSRAFWQITIDELLRLDPARAMVEQIKDSGGPPGSYLNLCATVKRKPKTPDSDIPAIKGETLATFVDRLNAFLDTKDNQEFFRKKMVKDDEMGNLLLSSVYRLIERLSDPIGVDETKRAKALLKVEDKPSTKAAA